MFVVTALTSRGPRRMPVIALVVTWTARVTQWRHGGFRTNLWLMPALGVIAATGLFVVTSAVDHAAYRGSIRLPAWLVSASAEDARQFVWAIGGAVIAAVGIVFSITVVTLTLASTQFGPRMLRNLIRDRGTQLTLGALVGTFVYTVLVVASIQPGDHGDYVPRLSITTSLVLGFIDLGVFVYIIHHSATRIQLPQVIAEIASELIRAAELQSADDANGRAIAASDAGALDEVMTTLDTSGVVIRTSKSGYLRFLGHRTLVAIAAESGAVLRLRYRPGHFLVQGSEFATVWPPEAADQVARCLKHAVVTGPHRNLTQDVAFGIDQLVEIAMRALSLGVDDTFTAIACVDWLCDSLCKIAKFWAPKEIHLDDRGTIRVIARQVSFERLVQRAFEKLRQASRGMPALMIRQLEALTTIMAQMTSREQAQVLMDQATMISRASIESVPEEADRADVQRRYDALVATFDGLKVR
ncbi:DUF2254 domain-containing protein [Mycobacterium szulgai]|uniref:DUF2254 domain-containing protein n=1 Tax=Mycobacterium szulgai TaxID=1787 RepID=UPI0021F33E08|nr:DUF2254 domain-containing protein [Mycobacterium szulgai]